MAKISFKKGLLASLPSSYTEGTFYVTTDERALYLDVDGSTRIRLGDFQEFENIAALKENTNPSTTALYYVKDMNVLAKWNGSGYVQINLDTARWWPLCGLVPLPSKWLAPATLPLTSPMIPAPGS